MKKTFLITFLIVAFVSGIQAQSIKIATVDIDRLHRSYYKTREADAKLQKALETATQKAQKIQEDGKTLLDEYREIEERSNNPALTEEARQKAKDDLQAKSVVIQQKQMEFQQFQVNTRKSFEQRRKSMRDLMLDEIKKITVQLAREKGANLVFDTSGVSLIGIPAVLHADPAWDMTEDVLLILNANAPVETEDETIAPSGE